MKDTSTHWALGPKMQRLNERQQMFVYWMARGAPSMAAAARAAGYSDKSSGAKVMGFRMMQDPRILEALHEVSSKLLHGMVPRAMVQLGRLVEDRAHPAHAKALEMVLSRTGFVVATEHKVLVDDARRDPTTMVARVRELAGQLGIDPAQLLGAAAEPKVIEHQPLEEHHE